jgi:hypothetical protein
MRLGKTEALMREYEAMVQAHPEHPDLRRRLEEMQKQNIVVGGGKESVSREVPARGIIPGLDIPEKPRRYHMDSTCSI